MWLGHIDRDFGNSDARARLRSFGCIITVGLVRSETWRILSVNALSCEVVFRKEQSQTSGWMSGGGDNLTFARKEAGV